MIELIIAISTGNAHLLCDLRSNFLFAFFYLYYIIFDTAFRKNSETAKFYVIRILSCSFLSRIQASSKGNGAPKEFVWKSRFTQQRFSIRE